MSSNANENIKIARFIDISACGEVFSEYYSTFLIRSHKYYWNIEDPNKRDPKEFQVQGENGHMETGFGLLSCWTILKGEKPSDEEWKIFETDLPEKSPVIAIISSPQKVYNLLYKTLNIERKDGRTHPFFDPIKHKEVRYIDKSKEKLKGMPTIWDAIFTKDEKFIKENEYRFCVFHSAVFHEIIAYIFDVQNPYDYIDKCYFNPSSTKENASKLLKILSDAPAGYGGGFSGKGLNEIIANEDDLIACGI
ncbi:MAG: hypothetical protein KJ887_01955 [Candidatus Omnitrophica bacterium]|nr:hypothetical protein [Candidatus Omnitrophota bacterium]MBU1047832.1 hypothetical protein [Candidatus Omnitrophota bacterium]MBU1630567.1 hypothetical protein [Candidatus Omnitrophota bacterium]MBU1888454.1 hypothetical protein [Candidatus Omnitrophota bacterium]